MSKRLMLVVSILLFSAGVASAQSPSPEAMAAARNLVTTLKLSDQYKALLPAILLRIKPVVVQDRPEIERDYDAMTPAATQAYAPYYTAMIDRIATVYADSFSVEEMHEIDAFYRKPAGQKYLEKSPAIMQQAMQVGEDGSRKAAEDLTQILRQKRPKL